MHTRVLKKSITRSTWAAEEPLGIAVALASGAENLPVLLVERGPVEAAEGAAKNYFFRLPDDFASRILRQAIEELIDPVLSADTNKATIPEIDEIGRGPEIKVTGVRLAWTEFPFQVSSSVERDDRLVIGRRRIAVTVRRAEENKPRIRVNGGRRPDTAAPPIIYSDNLTLTV